jgi:hypothetical protein
VPDTIQLDDGQPDATPQTSVELVRPFAVIDLALATKMSADEAFLAEDLVEAERSYAAAERLVQDLMQIPQSRRDEVAMLREDIGYRRQLLAGNFAFWGIMYSTRPLNPVAHFQNFKADVAQLVQAVESLRKEQDALRALQLEQLRAVAAQERNTAESGLATLEGQQAEIADDHHERREEELRARIGRVQELQTRLRIEQQQALAQLDAQRSATNAILMKGVSSALGVPPELTAVANGGDLRAAIVSAGTRLAGNPEFVSSLGELGHVATLVSDVYAKGKEVVDRVKEGVQTAEQLSELVRRPTLEKLAALGARIYPNLDEGTRRSLEDAVKTVKPLIPLLQIARSSQPVTAALRQWLAKDPSIDRVLVAAASLDEHRGHFAAWYTETMRKVAALDLARDAIEPAFDQLLRGWPSTVFDRLPAEAQRELLKRLGAANKDQAIVLLRQKGVAAFPISVEQGRILIPSLSVRLDLEELAGAIDPNQLPDLDAELECSIAAGLDRLAGAERHVLDELLGGLEVPRLEQLLGPALQSDPDRASTVFEAVLAGSGTEAQAVVRQLAELQAGAAAAADPGISASAPSDPPGQFQPPPQQTGETPGGVAALQAALAGPLGAAFPEAKIAQMAISWVAGNAAMVSAIDRINRISDQMQRYVLEEIHLRDEVGEAEYRQEIALSEMRVADQRKRMATAAARRNADEIRQIAETANTLRDRIINAYRIANIFYFAERVRLQFDSLNRALRMWTASYDQGADFVRLETYRSPDQLRLALDPQIRLFDLIGNPDLERQRLDLDLLAQSWTLLEQVADELCEHIGCSGANPAIGKVDFTPAYHLSDVLSEAELGDLRQWQRRRQTGVAFRTGFLMHPAAVGRVDQPPAPDRRAVRVVDVGLTTLQAGGRKEQSQVRLTHPGVGYIEGAGGFYTETMMAARAIGGRPTVDQLRPSQSYAQRWAEAGGHALGPLEGYALFAEWMLEFPPNAQNWALEDLELTFVYQYQEIAPATERQARAALLEGALPIMLAPDQVVTIGPPDKLQRKIESWMAADPPWTHGPLVAGPRKWMTEASPLQKSFEQWIAR